MQNANLFLNCCNSFVGNWYNTRREDCFGALKLLGGFDQVLATKIHNTS